MLVSHSLHKAKTVFPPITGEGSPSSWFSLWEGLTQQWEVSSCLIAPTFISFTFQI